MLYLPVGQKVQIDIESRDVAHSFWIIDFLYKKDMIPAQTNHWYFTPREGSYKGKCAELCGEYHSDMLFKVEVVSQEEYDAYIESLRDAGNEGRLGAEYNTNSNLPGDGRTTRTRTGRMSTANATTPSADDRTRTPALCGASVERKGNILVKWITTTDHKTIGYLYLITSFIYFLIGGVLALVIRAELFTPGLDVVPTNEAYNQLFTMHGTIMLLMFATPLFAGFANVVMPLQIGAPDVAFPRLNAFAYWMYFFGSFIAVAGFFTPQGAAAFGWTAYSPLTSATFSPGVGGNLWVFGLALSGFGTIIGAVNFITTIITMRAPGMTMFRMPIFSWNILVTSILVLMAFPILAAGLFALGADRVFGAASAIRPTEERSSGSTCSGSSVTPRSTSSRCRSSASSPRCCLSSAGSRSSGTRR